MELTQTYIHSYPPAKYDFHQEEVSLAKSSLGENGDEKNETGDALTNYMAGWEEVDAHLWGSELDGEDGNVEIMSILNTKLPLLLLAMGWILFVELTAVMQRRGRDRELQCRLLRCLFFSSRMCCGMGVVLCNERSVHNIHTYTCAYMYACMFIRL